MTASPRRPFGLYVHVPFCPQRCPYCAFSVVTGRRAEEGLYVDRLCGEIETWARLGDRGGLDTVFFGGGTPSRLDPRLLGRILETADRFLGLRRGVEVTCEANPSTAEAGRFRDLRRAGVTRLSLGVQSLRDSSLRRLGRAHDAAEAGRAYGVARAAGFDSVGMDLIFSIPGAAAADWEHTVKRAIALAPDHLSAYALTVEEGTAFARRRAAGDLPEVGEAEDEEAWFHAVESFAAAGYEHYEISNFARPGHRCAHNWDAWTGGEYVGVGVSAHSFLEGRRFWNTPDFDDYLQRMAARGSARAGEEPPDEERCRRDRLWLGLRTCAGVELEAEESRRLAASALWPRLRAHGHATLDGRCLRLTERGFAVADAVAAAVSDEVRSRAEAA